MSGLPFPTGLCFTCLKYYNAQAHECEYPNHCPCRMQHLNARPKPATDQVVEERHGTVWTRTEADQYYAGEPGDMVPMPAIVFRHAYPELWSRFWPDDSVQPHADPACKECGGSGYSRNDAHYGFVCPCVTARDD